MAGAAIVINHKFDDRKVKAAFNRLLKLGSDMTPIMEDMGEALLITHKDRHEAGVAPDGTLWAPLWPETKKRKKKNQDLILVLEGYLMQLHYQVDGHTLEIGNGPESADYAATHQFGDEDRGIVARPFLGISIEDEVEILEIVQDHLHSAIE